MEDNAIQSEQRINRIVFEKWEAFCSSSKGLTVMFLWALAEAIFWPIIPDGLLFPMAIGRRTQYWKLLGVAILGSTLGGIAIYLFSYFLPEMARSILPHMPVIQAFMIEKVSIALDQQGAMAFWTQPWSGIPFKVFAMEGGARGINPFRALSLSIIARGVRMFISSIIPWLLARHFSNIFRDFWIYFLLAYLIVFGYVWVMTQLIG
jgi:membrane protein YqaA with SNARE-associated domain